MKLESFRERKTKKKGILLFTICCVLLIAGAFFSSSFALFETNEHFNIIEDQIQDPKDLYFAYYIEDEIVLDPPSKDSGYILASKSSCNNGVTILWDVEDWSAVVNYSSYAKNPNVRTKCNLYFEKRTFENSVVAFGKLGESGASCMVKNAFLNTTHFMNDETNDNNLRYVGVSPNNYVSFGGTYQTDIYDLYNSANQWQFGFNLTSLEECETFKSSHNFLSTVSCVKTHSKGDLILWRVIGVMNHIDNGNGVDESRIKIIRNDSTGPWSWDSSPSNINGGWGVNEWSQADMKTVLNDYYYYNGKDHQTCYVTGSDANVLVIFHILRLKKI